MHVWPSKILKVHFLIVAIECAYISLPVYFLSNCICVIKEFKHLNKKDTKVLNTFR